MKRLKPGQPGYLGHKTGPGVKKAHRPRTQRNVKKYMKTRETWARFKATAGIDPSLQFEDTRRKIGIHRFTALHIVNGLTDTKLSTAIHWCQKLNLDMNRFANACMEAWEIAEQRYQVEEAIVQASVADGMDPVEAAREVRGREAPVEDAIVILSDYPLTD